MLEVPCVLYGDQPVHFQHKKKHSKLGLHSNAHTVVIDLGDGKSFTAILKDIQVHPVTDDILY
jgi:large subunit ribosomal protein L25